jgi:uncharacterized protein (TIGR02246 family)
MMKALYIVNTAIGLLVLGAGNLAPAQADDEAEPKATAATKAAAGEDPVHNELRALRDGLLAATNKGDVDAMLAFCHPNIRFTTPDGRVHRGHEGIRRYLDEMMKGPNAYVKSFKTDVTVDELTVMFGDALGIATGTAVDQFEVTGGNKFQLTDRWSAALVKEDGRWLVADYHTATNVFDNPILDVAKRSLYWAGGIGLVLGIVGGTLGARLLRRAPAKGAG